MNRSYQLESGDNIIGWWITVTAMFLLVAAKNGELIFPGHLLALVLFVLGRRSSILGIGFQNLKMRSAVCPLEFVLDDEVEIVQGSPGLAGESLVPWKRVKMLLGMDPACFVTKAAARRFIIIVMGRRKDT